MSGDDVGAELKAVVGGVDVKVGVGAIELGADRDREIGGDANIDGSDGAAGGAGEFTPLPLTSIARRRVLAVWSAGSFQVVGLIVIADDGDAIGKPAGPSRAARRSAKDGFGPTDLAPRSESRPREY